MDLYTPEEMDMGVNHGDNDEPIREVPMPDMSIERPDIDRVMNRIIWGNAEGRSKFD